MSQTQLDIEEYSKRDRILNALDAYPKRYRMSNQVVADLAEASTSYVYQLRTAIDEGDLSEAEHDSALDEDLGSTYREQIDGLLDEYEVPRTIDGDGGSTAPETDTTERNERATRGETATRTDGSVSLAEVERVRETMKQYRADADFERERFDGSQKNVAEAKYLLANRAVELLDEVLEN